jgi:hypothetical protein
MKQWWPGQLLLPLLADSVLLVGCDMELVDCIAKASERTAGAASLHKAGPAAAAGKRSPATV